MSDTIATWDIMIYFIYIGVLLFVGKIIKEKVPFINRIIIPTALIAGVIGLLLSDGFIGLIPLDRSDDSILSEIVYHSLAIGFIALSLKRATSKTTKKVWSTGMIIVMTYLMQAIVGATIVVTLFKDYFLGAGLLLPLGFGQGPGLASEIGQGYSEGVGELLYGKPLGITIASIGFLVGGVIGVIALNYYARKKKLNINKIHLENSKIKETYEFETIKEIRVFDALTTQMVIIFMIYGLVYLTLVFLEGFLFPEMGDLGETFAGVFHGFNFLLGIVYALIFGKVLSILEAKGKNVNFMTNNYVLSNISSIAFNFLITAAVLMITVDALTHYAAFIIVLALFGAGSTFIFIKIIVKKVYGPEYEIEYFLGLFGMLTGTASTGLALLKGIDEDFKTPVAEEMVLGSGTAIALALPLFALLMFPGLAIDTGNNFYNVLVFLVPGVYFFILLAITLFINRKK
ncbi:MAG: hypothetical protein QM489_06620 [Candidatus Izemoplasma sp.]